MATLMPRTAPPSLLSSPRHDRDEHRQETKPSESAPVSRRGERKDFFNVASYAAPSDRLGSTGVHAYAPLGSTLRRAGTATFGTAPRYPHDSTAASKSRTHSYVGQPSFLRKSGAVPFGKINAAQQKVHEPVLGGGVTACPVHSYYSDLKSTLRQSGATAFGKEVKHRRPLALCPVHSYSGLPTAPLRRAAPASFGRAAARPQLTGATPVHAYGGLTKPHVAAPASFGRAPARPGPVAATDVHAYAGQTSTLRRTAVSFGSMPSRCELTAQLAVSRTGLVSCARPSSAPRPPPRHAALRRPPSAPILSRAPQHRRPPTAPALLPSTTRVHVARQNGSVAEVLIFDDTDEPAPPTKSAEEEKERQHRVPVTAAAVAHDAAGARPERGGFVGLSIEAPPSPSTEEATANAAWLVDALPLARTQPTHAADKGHGEDEASPTSVTASHMPRGLTRARVRSAPSLASPAA